MSSDRDPDDAKDDLKQGLGLLWRAARKAATVVRKDLDRTNVGRAIDDAGRELVRAASNVVGRLGAELKKAQPSQDDAEAGDRGDEPAGAAPADAPADAPKPPAGPTPEDPGFRIAVDDAPPKDGEPR
jgi:hypothetical protein